MTAEKPAKQSYRDTLNVIERDRYVKKLEIIDGVDPYETKTLSEDVSLLPAITYPDIVNYLVFTPSPYTMDDLKSYKGLEAYNQFICGWVSNISTSIINGKHLVKAKVLHSQRLRDKALQPWVIAEKDGKILASHCTCMAGLGEACTHVASVLFAIDGTVKSRDSRTVTQEPAYWLLPSSIKTVTYSQTKDIDFSSAKTLKRRFDNSCAKPKDSPGPSLTPNAKPKRNIPAPTEDELKVFYRSLQTAGCRPALLSVIKEFSDDYVPKTSVKKFPKQLTELKEKEAMNLNYKELLDKCADINISISEEEIHNVSESTKAQADDRMWYKFRAGRITASNMKSVCSTDAANPSQTLIKKVCYPVKGFETEATKYGRQNEKIAMSDFIKTYSKEHENVVFEASGLQISSDKPFIAASPDGFINCDCCGRAAVEIKCPYTRKMMPINEQVEYLVLGEDGSLSLNPQHAYYYQVQTQMGVTGLESCYFVVWSGIDIHVEQILFNEEFFSEICVKSEILFRTAVLPELVGKFYSRLPGTDSSAPSSAVLGQHSITNNDNLTNTEEEERWCYCDQVESGRMIYCDNQNCPIVWFHFTCLKMTNEPKGKAWYCPDCRKLPEFSRKRAKLH